MNRPIQSLIVTLTLCLGLAACSSANHESQEEAIATEDSTQSMTPDRDKQTPQQIEPGSIKTVESEKSACDLAPIKSAEDVTRFKQECAQKSACLLIKEESCYCPPGVHCVCGGGKGPQCVEKDNVEKNGDDKNLNSTENR